MDTIEKIFGESGKVFFPIIESIEKENKEFKYEFLYDNYYSKLLETDVNKGMQIYWKELLEYSHIASFNSVVRHKKWLDGMVLAYNTENYILFSASWRGFLESVSDSYYTISAVPKTIADNFRIILDIVNKSYNFNASKALYTSEKLEEKLIHYVFGRRLKKNESSPKYHKALTVTDYLKNLKTDNLNLIQDSYSTLCQITHPAHLSVINTYDFKYSNEKYTQIYNPSTQKEKINDLIDEYSKTFNDLFINGFNPQIITLKLLNEFNIDNITTSYVNLLNYEKVALWNNIVAKIKST